MKNINLTLSDTNYTAQGKSKISLGPEENAKLKAATTTVEASDDTAETENVEEFAYVNSIKNLVKKVKQLN